MKKLIDWHRAYIESAQKALGLDNYALYWSGFLEGALFFWILTKILAFINRPSVDIPF